MRKWQDDWLSELDVDASGEIDWLNVLVWGGIFIGVLVFWGFVGWVLI